MLRRALDELRPGGLGAVIPLVGPPLPLPPAPGLEVVHVPTMDGEAPDDLERLCELIDAMKQRSLGTFVHCQAGQGRTGTVLAAYLIWSERVRAWDAIDQVRQRYHPRAVETPQ